MLTTNGTMQRRRQAGVCVLCEVPTPRWYCVRCSAKRAAVGRPAWWTPAPRETTDRVRVRRVPLPAACEKCAGCVVRDSAQQARCLNCGKLWWASPPEAAGGMTEAWLEEQAREQPEAYRAVGGPWRGAWGW